MKETFMEKLKRKAREILSGEQGVTLIELLAVVVILAIIAAVAVPAVMGNFSSAKANTDLQNEKIIVDAITRSIIDYDQTNGNNITDLANSASATSALGSGGTVDITTTGTADSQIYVFGTVGGTANKAGTITLNGNYLNQIPVPQAPAGKQTTTFSIGANTYTITESSTAGQWTIKQN
ncbi:prepilin-type N-terminal cleavage/methylation domain-containing protein [Fodinisporobacter ferrooxydans]|uniref:Prepilin-type N-terminal cleavage/methylation domain-containing protein n=1 Tax=Fodinisporobacter ferrooxydans TaxID=2901836 RepID=A0ABY4CJI3_9BACL|nr:prepilin-type N-terminal cleavage/methylation domain-containing protein [Alicyclobacillaceae bacterium MYW30-H2]